MAGKESEKKDATVEALRSMREVKSIHDIIERNSAERDRVRGKYK